MFLYQFNIYYIILVIPAFLFSLWAQSKVKGTFNKYSKTANRRGATGADIARFILRTHGLTEVQVESVQGNLTDHYDPKSKVVRLSSPVYGSQSLSAIGVAAHETGHAIQDAKGYGPLRLRSMFYPAASLGSSFGPTMAIFGIFFNFDLLTNLGILLFALAVVFYLITLPVEIDASNRALKILGGNHLLDPGELKGAKKVLQAAAMTYVASAAVAIANLLHLILRSRD